jgi:hypothetical protein
MKFQNASTEVFLYIPQGTDGVQVRFIEVDITGGTLSALQSLVDGLVDVVSTPNGDVWVNDEGLYRNDFERNFIASVLTGRDIVGPAVITDSTPDGETISVSLQAIAYLQAVGVDIHFTPCTVEEIVAERQQLSV